jgi:hypothetical protein
MREFTFWLPIHGHGDTPQEAWEDAIANMQAGIAEGEYEAPPAALFGPEDEIPAAEILGGSLSGGFGIDPGPESDDEESPDEP